MRPSVAHDSTKIGTLARRSTACLHSAFTVLLESRIPSLTARRPEFRLSASWAIVIVLACVVASPVYGQSDPPASLRESWKMETLVRVDGRELRGMLLSLSKDGVEFVEVVRPRGKAMFLVIHEYPVARVKSVRRLPQADRKELAARIEPQLRLRSRARIEAAEMEGIELQTLTVDGQTQLRWDSRWFELTSTADADTTRRCAVRIDQIFRAYAYLLSPRNRTDRKIRLMVFGSMDSYRGHLQRIRRTGGLSLEAPAFYSTRQNQVVAGSDLSRYAERLSLTRAANERVAKQLKSLEGELRRQLKVKSEELKKNGFSDDEIRKEFEQRWANWHRLAESMTAKIVVANRVNDAHFQQITREMFRRLYHEAFHAWLENYVFPHQEYDVPRWLNEGLAQVFESGRVEAGRLRIDAPPRDLLVELRNEFRTKGRLPLAALLASDGAAFLMTHEAGASRQHYVYSWGLAWYLTFDRQLTSADSLAEYVSPDPDRTDPVERFETWVHQPLEAFERQWHDYMLSLPLSITSR